LLGKDTVSGGREPAVKPTLRLRGVDVYQGFLAPAVQTGLVEDLRGVIRQAPLFTPDTPYGKPMSVAMTSMGRFGWFSDRQGYRYRERHPNGVEWPVMPETVLTIWRCLFIGLPEPESCLINFYGEGARMGMHQDKDEADFRWPVLSVSLGDEALFRVGNLTRGGKTESIWLRSGDVVVLGGDARLAYHGVDRIRFGSSTLLPKGGRINLTLRVVS
jgi:DNA oxidative demethylase